jgi:tetratricopeptide (TPR) repeat protein
MVREDWYAAAESLLECLKLNPAHAEGTAALAECYYELEEHDQALSYVRRARTLARGSTALANLEAFILIAMGRLENASAVVAEVLSREPYNKDALFAAAEMDIARGRTGDAISRYQEVIRRYPDDRRVLISLALVLGSVGDADRSRTYIERALLQHSGDHRVQYYAAYLDAQAGRIASAIRYAGEALALRPGYAPARSLLAILRYRSGQFEEAARLADEAIADTRDDTGAWYLKGLSYSRLGRHAEAIGILSTGIDMNAHDEFIRIILEDQIISHTPLEDPRRSWWASWHFNRAREYRSRNLGDQALFEYRRGLRLNPYAAERREFAEILKTQKYPARYLEELRFIQDLGVADRRIDEAVEAYNALLADALYRRWGVNPADAQRHWKVAVFSVAAQSGIQHVDAGSAAAAYIRDLLVHDRNLDSMSLELRQPSFSQAYRIAREAGADYFLVISVSENPRDLSIKGELFVARTGSAAGTFSIYRAGTDRLRNAARGIVEQFSASLPFRGALLRRRSSQGLIDKGRADGVRAGQVYEVVKKNQPAVQNAGIGLVYSPEDIVGTLVIEQVDEEVSAGTISRRGFFDLITEGDEIILQPQEAEQRVQAEFMTNPELRALLRTLR